MRIAILAESPADATAIHAIVDATLGITTEYQAVPYRLDGFSSVQRNLSSVIRWIHYQQTADALVVVVDSDESPIDLNHGQSRGRILRSQVANVVATLSPVRETVPLVRTAVAVAVPAIEAWLAFGADSRATEAGWLIAFNGGTRSHNEIRRLKNIVYGTERPALAIETRIMRERIERLITEGQLEALTKSFPNGLGSFVAELRAWELPAEEAGPLTS